jgi:tetratricopeptide (TPR) repeat protein
MTYMTHFARLLHICYAPADHGWVHGRMLPALGLVAEQYRTRTDDALGEQQLSEIARAVEECRYTVLVASDAACRDRLVRFAADLAQHAAVEQQTPRFFVIEREVLPIADAERAQRPLSHRAIVGLDCSAEQRTVESLERLRRLLEQPQASSVPPVCPYPGLESFSAANRHLLFGRDRDREAILHRIRAGHSRLLVIGPSGSGKSSLIHAAVLPELRSDQYLVRVVPRGGDLAGGLRQTIDALEVVGAGAAFDRYQAALHDAGDFEYERARAGLRDARVLDTRRRIVVIDPLEEIFAADDASARTALFQLLTGLWSLPWCTVILCMRADFYGALMAERCWRELEHHQLPVAPPDDSGLRAAIIEPAKQVDVHIEPLLVERLIREIDRDRSAAPLPLLQVALKELWQRLSHRYLTVDAYERILSHDQRGLGAVLAVHANGVLQELAAPGDRVFAQRILLDLVKHRRFEGRARAWVEAGRAAGLLDEGDTAEACAWRDSPGGRALGVSACLVELIDASESAQTRARHEKEELLASLANEHHRTLGSTVAAVEAADAIAYQIDTHLQPLQGASGVRAALLARTRELLEHLRTLGLLEGGDLHTDIALKAAQADVALKNGRVDEAFRLFREVNAGSKRVAPNMQAEHASSHRLLKTPGSLDDARAWFEDTLMVRETLTDADPVNVAWRHDMATAFDRLGDVAFSAGRFDDAHIWFENRLAVCTTLADAEPANAAWQHDLAQCYEKLANLAAAAGRLEDARNWFDRSLARRNELGGTAPAPSQTATQPQGRHRPSGQRHSRRSRRL